MRLLLARGGWIGKATGLVPGVAKELSEPRPPSDVSEITDPSSHFSGRYSGDGLCRAGILTMEPPEPWR